MFGSTWGERQILQLGAHLDLYTNYRGARYVVAEQPNGHLSETAPGPFKGGGSSDTYTTLIGRISFMLFPRIQIFTGGGLISTLAKRCV